MFIEDPTLSALFASLVSILIALLVYLLTPYVRQARGISIDLIAEGLETAQLDEVFSIDEITFLAERVLRGYLTANNLGSYDERFGKAVAYLVDWFDITPQQAEPIVAGAAQVIAELWKRSGEYVPVDDETLKQMIQPVKG